MRRTAGMTVVLLAAALAIAQSQSDPDVPVLKRRPPRQDTTQTQSRTDTAGPPTNPPEANPQPRGTPISPPEPPPSPEPPVPPASTAGQPAPGTHGMSGHDHHADVMEHGRRAMGFDQRTTTHHFVLTRSGGLVRVTVNDPADSTTVGQINSHLRTVAAQFARGDFSAPEATHSQVPPGSAEMRQLRSKIVYTAHAIQDGAELIISSSDPKAVDAIHRFLQFQIQDHQTGDPVSMR